MIDVIMREIAGKKRAPTAPIKPEPKAAEPIRPVNFEIPSVDREGQRDALALRHLDQRRVGQVHRQAYAEVELWL
jgi:hypothetical protein